jgi:hypothetical protein
LTVSPALGRKFTGLLELSAVFSEANARDIVCIDVGDWGIEVGFGRIWQAVAGTSMTH